MPTLFDPLKVGAIDLPNRIVMAPLTRSRAHPETRVPSDLAVEYYRQRAGFGLIISEATSVSPMGVGYAATPGIWSDEQTEGWSKITRAVHAGGGRMLLQLWHVGRISDPMFLGGALPEAPSALASMAWRYMAPMAICWINSSKTPPICAATPMAARARSGPA